MSRKKKAVTLDEFMREAIVPKDEHPYVIPENWVWSKLDYIADWGSGGTPKSTKKEYYNGEIPWLIIGDLNDGIVIKSDKTITELGLKNSSAKLVKKGSILIAMYGSIGKLGIAGEECTTNQAIAFTNKCYVNNEYLFYYLLGIRSTLLSMGKGGTQQNISQTVLKEVKIPIPAMKEQLRIAEKVKRLISKIDEAKKIVEEAKETFEFRRAVILEKAFSGEFTEQWRKLNIYSSGHEFEHFHANRLANISSPKELKKFGFSNYSFEKDIKHEGNFPTSWIQAPIGFICECIVPGRDKPKSFTGEIPWITMPDIKSNLITKSSKEIGLSEEEIKEVKAKVIPTDSVIMSCVGRFGISAVVKEPLVINQQLHAFLPNEMIDSTFLMYQIRTLEKYMNSIATSTTIAYLNKTNANSLPIKLPPIEEQQEIVKIIDRILTLEEMVIRKLPTLKQLDELKQSILSKAFKGELGTNDSNDEPAFELLKSVLQEN